MHVKGPTAVMRRLRVLFISLAAVVGLVLTGCAPGIGVNGTGSVLRVATDLEPPTIDWQQSQSSATQMLGVQVLETLYSLDQSYMPVPQLASAMPTAASDGLTYTIPLRRGVEFHDGSTMTPTDVVASLERWGRVSKNGQSMYQHVKQTRAISDSEVQLELSSPYDVVRALAVPISAAAIMPAKVLENVGVNLIGNVAQMIGTGPYKLTEWSRGLRYVLERFADYHAANNGATSGIASARPATYQRVEVNVVVEPTTRLYSTLAGQYDVGLKIAGELYDSFKGASNVSRRTVLPFYSQFLMLNTSKAPFDNLKVRQAAALALDRKAISEATYGSPDLFTPGGGIYPTGTGVLSTGRTGYSQNIDQAKKLLQESGYDGSPVSFMTNRDIVELYNGSIATAQQLKAVGFNVSIDVMDPATMTSRVGQPKSWDLFSASYGAGYVLPSAHLILNGYYPFKGWYGNSGPIKTQLDRWNTATSDQERGEVMRDIENQFFEDTPAIKIADYAAVEAVSNSVELGDQGFYWPTWWSVTPRNSHSA